MIEVIRFEEAREIWEKAVSLDGRFVPFMRYDWHKVWYETLGSIYSPLVLVYDKNTVFPFAVDGERVFFSGGDETSDYLEVIGDTKHTAMAWQEVLVYLATQGYKTLALRNVPEGATVAFFRSIGVTVNQEDTTPIIDLQTRFDEYLASLPRRWRKELKRKMKNFEIKHEGVYLEEEGSLDCLISLMKKNDEKRQFFDRPGMEEYFRAIYKTFPTMARIRCLSVRGVLAASIYYFETPTSYLLYNSGFDKENFDSAGFYLKALHVKRAIEAGKKTYNFLQGSERYKYELGGKDSFVYAITMNLGA